MACFARGVFVYNRWMFWRCMVWWVAGLGALGLNAAAAATPQQAPPATAARILLLPRQIVSGETATLAVLDVNGRLTPGATVSFSNGDTIVTNATGRARFVAPLNAGVIYATVASRPTRVYTTILSPAEASSASLQIGSVPRFASLADRFEVDGRGFCGEADANNVRVGGKPALVLAASPTTLIVLPPGDAEPGPADVEVSCETRSAPPVSITFLVLALEADSSPLSPGEHRTLTVQVTGTNARVPLEARNLSPEIAELSGGNPAKASSSGGAENSAQFDLVGLLRGNFLISVRLLPSPVLLQP